jgi:hypothetical protein
MYVQSLSLVMVNVTECTQIRTIVPSFTTVYMEPLCYGLAPTDCSRLTVKVLENHAKVETGI